jgi:hypothetical protein
MRRTRTEKRYNDSVQPGAFDGFEPETVQGSGAQVSSLVRREGGSVQLGKVEAARSAALRLSFDRLRTKAELLADQVDYLGERLVIVDHDRRGMFIQLRSLPPMKDENGIQFNEINLGRDSVVMQRIAFTRKDEVKQQIPINLSQATLDRLLSDLRQVLAS